MKILRVSKILIVSTAVTLLVSLTPQISNAAPKVAQGATCKSLNKKSTYQNKTYTCIKKNGKLVWSKGVAVKNSNSNVIPSPQPTIQASPTPTPSQSTSPENISNQNCLKENEILRNAAGEFWCLKGSDGQLRWSRNNIENQPSPTPTPTPTPTPSPTPSPTPTQTPKIQLPTEGTACPKLGTKVIGDDGFMKCAWQGGPTNDFLKNIKWSYVPFNKISTSKSNNYTTIPTENASCTNSGDTFDVTGGILECRWIKGQKLQWIKINTVKNTFTNAKSPVSIETCKLQNSASVADRTGRNSSGLVGFPLVNSDRNRMYLKGTNEVLIVPIDFPDFPGGNEVLAQLEYDKKWMNDWFNYFSNGKSKFNITTIDKWLRMPKERSAYPSDAKTEDAFAADHGRRMADQAQPFIEQISNVIDIRKFSTVYFFYPDGEITFVDFIIRNQFFKTKYGDVQLNVFSWGKNLEGMETLKWAYYIHETMHDFGISMHAPGNGWPLGIGTQQSGISLALNPWEQFLFDWLPSEQIYCDDFATLKTATVSLTPVEREDRQTKMAVIRLSPTKAVVVESHGIDKWSNFKFGDREFPPGFYSIMAYVVDLDKNAAPPIYSDGTSRTNDEWAWAVWQKVQGERSNQFNKYVGENKNLADYVAVLGDSFVIEGVKIKFVATGDYETIEISKA